MLQNKDVQKATELYQTAHQSLYRFARHLITAAVPLTALLLAFGIPDSNTPSSAFFLFCSLVALLLGIFALAFSLFEEIASSSQLAKLYKQEVLQSIKNYRPLKPVFYNSPKIYRAMFFVGIALLSLGLCALVAYAYLRLFPSF